MGDKNKMVHLKISTIIIILALLMSCTGCAVPQHEYRAYIENSTDWQMKEECGYEGCYPLVDILVGDEMKLRFDFYKIQNGKLIFAKLVFQDVEDDIEFCPKRIMAKLNRKEMLQIKCFKCDSVIWDYKKMKVAQSIDTTIVPQKNDCYMLFFDYQDLNKEEITMDINGALTLNGRSINIPNIYFKKNPEYKE